jgi:hypothetical protein
MLLTSAETLTTIQRQNKNKIHLIRRTIAENGSVKDEFCLNRANSGFELVWIPNSIRGWAPNLWEKSGQIHSISFESNSRLIRIESDAFSFSSLQSIEIPRNVEILGSSCFSDCNSLSSISFESNSISPLKSRSQFPL